MIMLYILCKWRESKCPTLLRTGWISIHLNGSSNYFFCSWHILSCVTTVQQISLWIGIESLHACTCYHGTRLYGNALLIIVIKRSQLFLSMKASHSSGRCVHNPYIIINSVAFHALKTQDILDWERKIESSLHSKYNIPGFRVERFASAEKKWMHTLNYNVLSYVMQHVMPQSALTRLE